MRRHPPPETLRRWLDGDVNEKITDHVESCAQCADSMEGLVDEAPALLSVALVDVLTTDDSLAERMATRVAESLAALDAAGAFFELFSVGVQTAQIVLTEGERP